MAWKKDDKKSPKAQPQAKTLPASRRGRPPVGTVAAKARFDKPKKGGYHTRESTGGAKAKAIRQAALRDVRDNTVVDVEGVMAHVRATMPIAEYLKETSSEYNPYVGRALCFVIATSDLGLEDAMALVKPELEADGVKVPHHMVVYKWRKEDKDFDTLYRDARLMQSHYLVDCAMRYAKGPLPAVTTRYQSTGPFGPVTTTTTTDNVSRSRLIVETIMRRAAQLNPDYREKREEDSDKPNEQLEALVAALKGGDDEDDD